MKNSKRFQFIDVVAGIMICWMILGHCNYFSPGHKLEFYKYISFFMPYFYYKSGWFFKPTSQKALIKKDTNKLICYYVFFSVLGVIVWSILRIPEGNSLSSSFKIAFAQFIRNGSFSGNGALWFLLSLFLVRQIANNVLKYKFSSFFTPLICFGFAYGLFKLGWHEHSWWLGNVFSGLCFCNGDLLNNSF